MRIVRRVVAVLEQAANQRPRAKDLKVVGRYDVAVDALGVPLSREAHGLGLDAVRVESGQRLRALAQVPIVRIRDGVESATVLRAPHIHELVGLVQARATAAGASALAIGEDRRVRANSNGQ